MGEIRECTICGNGFEPYLREKCCSKECVIAWFSSSHEIKECKICEKRFVTTTNKRKLCTNCKNKK